ncbi:MAG: phosphoserine phosphatase SerB [Acetobacteraceae bacterium]|nr:phosphoserine phosphatase SerB [Acetobacteraceae bacterium]
MTYVLTLIADRRATTLSAGQIEAVRDAVYGAPAKILSDGEACDIATRTPPNMTAVAAAIGEARIDVITTAARNRRKAVLIADMDSTIVTSETLDEIAAYAGLKDEIAAITRASMNGEVDFADALRQRVAMLKGLSVDALEQTWATTELMPGARELVATMRAHNALTALVSGGFTWFTGRVATLVGFDEHRANTLLEADGALTGKVGGPILDRDAKLATLLALVAERGVQMAATLAIGDGANDLAMLREAGLGIAYHAKPIVAAEARAQIRFGDLRGALFAQGYAAKDFRSE